MKILIAVSILLFTQLSSAAFFKTNKACYNIRLKASMVDVNECRRTKVVVTTVNCREIKQRLNQENFNAELNSCKKNKAAGVLDINGDKVKINIFKSSQFGIERWSVVNKSAKMRNNKIYKVYKKTPDKKIKAPKLNLVKQEARPVNDFSFGSNSKFYFYFDTYMAYNSNDPSNGSGGFGDIQNMLRMSDPNHLQFNFGLINFGYSNETDLGRLKVEMAYGPTYNLEMASPIGKITNLTHPFSELNYTYSMSQSVRSNLIFGKFKAPLFKSNYQPTRNNFYSFGIAESIGIPHFHTGINWERGWGKNFISQLYIVNGWNQDEDLNSSFSFGANAKYMFSKNLSFEGDVYTGDEADTSTEPTSNRLVIRGGVNYKFNKKINTQFAFLYGTSASEDIAGTPTAADWSGLLAELSYTMESKSIIGFRFENFTNTGGFLADEKSPENTMSIGSSYKRFVNKNLSLIGELRGEFADTASFRSGAANFSDSQITALISAGINY